ncbi:hypothetical protein DBR37_12470 [Herminiimonas sp. KBW02]|uniref:hypothetical protein n=1 Tax=Herminiimonas sp. KBW02 TaxID=2153363 RepID=UPI000F5A9540|nr:hypothetical protein [Herminiimonas sp. KBW02]RQO33939.1 hypothetical protein DBR37_12470 [Herminiimonas sp. KBW02]
MSFRQIEDVDAWVQANGGVDRLRACISVGIFGNDVRSIALANEWLRLEEQKVNADQANFDRELRVREVAATEDAAKSAKLSARWAFLAMLISLAAFAVAALK